MDVNSLKDLYQHMEWADATVWSSVMESEKGQADTKLRETFYHLHVAQFAFLRLWQSEPRETPYPTFETAKSLMLWGQSYYSKVSSHLTTLTDEKILEPLVLPWATMVEKRLGKSPQMSTYGETLLQVPLHSLYHRGQINARLREVGGEPPLVDYIAWVWLGHPSPNWPSA